MNKAELKAAIEAEKKRHAEIIKGLESKLRVIEMEERSASRKAYTEKKALLEETGEWLEGKLTVGDLVQVTGSRAGKYRCVVAVNGYGIVGNVIYQKRIRTPEGIKVQWAKDVGKVTEQGFNKITHLYRDGKFVPVKELMKESEVTG